MNGKCNKTDFNNVPAIIASGEICAIQNSSEFITVIVHLQPRSQFVKFVNRSENGGVSNPQVLPSITFYENVKSIFSFESFSVDEGGISEDGKSD